MTVSLTPTGTKKEMLGHPCEEYTVAMKVPFQAPPKAGGQRRGARR